MVAVIAPSFQNLSWYVTDQAATCLAPGNHSESHGVAGNLNSNRRPEARDPN